MFSFSYGILIQTSKGNASNYENPNASFTPSKEGRTGTPGENCTASSLQMPRKEMPRAVAASSSVRASPIARTRAGA